MWILILQPSHKHIVKGKFVFKLKQWGDDYTKTNVPVIVFKNLHFILALMCLCNLKIHTMDIISAFLAKEIHVEQPEGYVMTLTSQTMCVKGTINLTISYNTSMHNIIQLYSAISCNANHSPSNQDYVKHST
ncbi:integrase [Acanthamoeba castellanii str. Neff]|uniref:Integrase n=1 Tax=Acanthamoeba castellanii (strain ATCC 30010 / Neff) TaxID=1257118 RepID=L8GKX8_ACACF|nr:integrase [Acanthamoeba castellanii str. Neff]ELR13383.1 integrase [Acanthamoeba castellanii str. Neff]